MVSTVNSTYRHGRAIILCLLTLLTAAGCGGGGSATSLDPARTSSGGFTVELLADSLVPGGELAGLDLDLVDNGDTTVVQVKARDASSLKALYFELAYNPECYNPVAAEATGELADGPDAVLEVVDLGTPGTVTHGQVLAGWEDRAGYSGSDVLTEVTFHDGPCTAGRAVSAPPVNDRDRPELVIDETASQLSWWYFCTGDYDQNGLVTVSDLTPLGRFFEVAGPFDESSAEYAVDGDGNGLINVSDITPIGQNYERGITSYHVYYVEDEQLRPENLPQFAELDPLLEVALADAGGVAGRDRLSFTRNQPLADPNGWFWVCPVHAGTCGLASASIAVGGGEDPENVKPVARISADPMNGLSPQTVQFDALSSTDADGELVGYEWDWDLADDFWDWEDTGTVATTEHVYRTPGTYTATLRVTDDQGAVAVDQVELTIDRGENQAPVAVLTTDHTDTHCWHNFKLYASASYDWDGEVVAYEWDMDGGWEWFINAEEPGPDVLTYFSEPGVYHPSVTVTDDSGATGTVDMEITVAENLPPVVNLTATPASGSAPLHVVLDPVGTYDPEDELSRLSWTVNGLPLRSFSNWHGDYDEDLLTPVEVDFLFSGDHECLLEVHDDHFYVEDSLTISVDGGWETDLLEITDTPERADVMDVVLADGRFAIVTDDSVIGSGTVDLYFMMAADESGQDWLPLVEIDTGLGLWIYCDLELVDGLPAVTYNSQSEGCIWYSRALDVEGREWGEPVRIGPCSDGLAGVPALTTIAGNPAIAYGAGGKLVYRRAADSTGATWNDLVEVDSGEYVGFPADMVEINGLPAICYTASISRVRYVLLQDVNGGTVFNIRQVPKPENNGGITISMRQVDGLPCILYAGAATRAYDSSGSSWSKPVIVCRNRDPEEVDYCHLTVFRGELISIVKDRQLQVSRSSDGYGGAWSTAFCVDESNHYSRQIGSVVQDDKLCVFYNQNDWDYNLVCRRIY